MKPRLNASTPHAKKMGKVLGHTSFEGVEFTRDQCRGLSRVYGFSRDQEAEVTAARALYHAAVAAGMRSPQPFDEAGIRAFYEAGAEREMFRHARHDGLRLMAHLSRVLQPGEDPVKLLLQLLADAGHDVDAKDLEWAFDEGDMEADADE